MYIPEQTFKLKSTVGIVDSAVKYMILPRAQQLQIYSRDHFVY